MEEDSKRIELKHIERWPVQPKDGLPAEVEEVGEVTVKEKHIIVFFCDDINEHTIQAVRKVFERDGMKIGVLGLPTNADISVMDRKDQERLYAYLGQVLGK